MGPRVLRPRRTPGNAISGAGSRPISAACWSATRRFVTPRQSGSRPHPAAQDRSAGAAEFLRRRRRQLRHYRFAIAKPGRRWTASRWVRATLHRRLRPSRMRRPRPGRCIGLTIADIDAWAPCGPALSQRTRRRPAAGDRRASSSGESEAGFGVRSGKRGSASSSSANGAMAKAAKLAGRLHRGPVGRGEKRAAAAWRVNWPGRRSSGVGPAADANWLRTPRSRSRLASDAPGPRLRGDRTAGNLPYRWSRPRDWTPIRLWQAEHPIPGERALSAPTSEKCMKRRRRHRDRHPTAGRHGHGRRSPFRQRRRPHYSAGRVPGRIGDRLYPRSGLARSDRAARLEPVRFASSAPQSRSWASRSCCPGGDPVSPAGDSGAALGADLEARLRRDLTASPATRCISAWPCSRRPRAHRQRGLAVRWRWFPSIASSGPR